MEMPLPNSAVSGIEGAVSGVGECGPEPLQRLPAKHLDRARQRGAAGAKRVRVGRPEHSLSNFQDDLNPYNMNDCGSMDCAERNLWVGVLWRAFDDLTDDDRKLRRRTRRWFQSRRGTIGSSRWICEQLDLSYDRLVRAVNGRRREQPARIISEH